MILIGQQNKQSVHPLSPLCLRIWLDYWVVCALYISHYADIFHLPLPFATHTIHNPSGSRGRHELIDIPRGMTHIYVGDAFEGLLSTCDDWKNVVVDDFLGFFDSYFPITTQSQLLFGEKCYRQLCIYQNHSAALYFNTLLLLLLPLTGKNVGSGFLFLR